MNWYYNPNLALDAWSGSTMQKFLSENEGESSYSDYLFGEITNLLQNTKDGIVRWSFPALWNDKGERIASNVIVAICLIYLDEEKNQFVIGTVSGDHIYMLRDCIDQRHYERSKAPVLR